MLGGLGSKIPCDAYKLELEFSSLSLGIIGGLILGMWNNHQVLLPLILNTSPMGNRHSFHCCTLTYNIFKKILFLN